MKVCSTFALLVLLAFSASAGDGSYSSIATSVLTIASMPEGLPSPDGKNRLRMNEILSADDPWQFQASLSTEGKTYTMSFIGYVNAEVAWSPDSRAFFVTYSDGGNVGTYHVLVFRVGAGQPHPIEIFRNGRRLFKPNCFDPEFPNIAAISWGADSKALIIAAEVPPHSSCASMGTFQAFEITIPAGKILRRYDQLEAKKLFSHAMGPELMNADDDCVRKPESCVPPGLKIPPPK